MDPCDEEKMRDSMLAELYAQANEERQEEAVRSSGDQAAIRKFEKQRMDEQIANHRLFERMRDAKDLEEQRRELYSAVDAKACSLEWANEEYAKLVVQDDMRRKEERAARLNAEIALARETAATQMMLEGPKMGQLGWGDWAAAPTPASSESSEEDVEVVVEEEEPSIVIPVTTGRTQAREPSPVTVAVTAVTPAASYDSHSSFNMAYEERYQALLKEDEELIYFIIDRHRMTEGRRDRAGGRNRQRPTTKPKEKIDEPVQRVPEPVVIPPLRKLSETIPVVDVAPAKTSDSLFE
jgi:hypothetical protein